MERGINPSDKGVKATEKKERKKEMRERERERERAKAREIRG